MKVIGSVPGISAWSSPLRNNGLSRGESPGVPCILAESCEFFNSGLFEMPCTTERLKERYCRGDYTRCARYIVANAYGRGHVSQYLSPSDQFESLKVN